MTEQVRFVWEDDLNLGAGVELVCGPAGVVAARFDPRPRKLTAAETKAAHAFGKARAWFWPAMNAVRAYLDGSIVDLGKLPVDLSAQPPFRRKVQEACRKIGYGKTLTYAELAIRAGNPKAVRAVGSAMSHNPLPLLVPCHRVVKTGGGLGGFSAPTGASLKEKLLAMERAAAMPSPGT